MLLSNRSHVHCLAGALEESLADADDVVATDSCWFKGHWRRAQALSLVPGRGSESLECFEDAYAQLPDPNGADAHAAQSIQREHLARQAELRSTGSTELCPELRRMRVYLAVPEGCKMGDYACHAAVLPATNHSGVDDRNGREVSATCPGDSSGPWC